MPPVALRVSTSDKQLTLPGDRPAVVGRGRDADVVIQHPRVSRQHVSLEPAPDGWLARDLSTNGMWQDGQRVAVARIGASETRLRLGGADGPELTVSALVPAAPPAPAPAEPDLGELETRLAPNTGGTPRPARPAAQAPAPAHQPTPAPAAPGGSWSPAPPVPHQPVPHQPAAPAARRQPARWLRTVPTLVWLFAAAFAIGALVALS
ncbi:FHA domain-containing protein [Frankia sp. CNm7]|uniref:FHA domain-containing protein n=1 Tax=Frankia nepalensis TaxID=1836974 RepID=A0A937RI44_9ACTN|nr:FHA domain-containing protein [Frankia nepalensis]MBL7497115.1 FHA domain-containing protein [Frankia nepalensis]MBL7510787.1 FHA domain-containing protein [Frankia nepalensis]MBL7521563.1 FHA domain-containing protein [Frankia nepalensis]MBL7626798.1 FHA domain-containing protein [Frankia nepalensis]